jgi:nucleotide-binding universal stress UspA family protein
MWGRIVLGTDGSPAANRAGETVATIARAVSAKLTAVTASANPDTAEDVLQGAVQAAEAAGMRAGDALVAKADELDAGLIAMARGDAQPLSDLGRWLAKHAPCDLLLVAVTDRDPHGPYGRILIASDGSATADRAARKGLELAQEIDAPVTLVFVGHPATGKLVMEDTVAMYGQGVDVDIRLQQGNPAELILQTAKEVAADVIVVGNRGLQGAKGFILGSVPESVLDGADVDVLLCRTVVQIASELAPGEGGVIERRGEKLAVFVDPKGEQLLFSARCTHLGCTVPWDEKAKRFSCPCHASAFDERGVVLSPPAPRPLDLYAVRIENGVVKVDTGTPILRESFQPSQVVKG